MSTSIGIADQNPADAAYGQAVPPSWLPSRPAAGDPVAGPVPSDSDPAKPAQPVRAICCSGGGIRSAAFCLGGLQALNAAPDGPGRTWYSNTDFVSAVSGGSYVASAYAIVQHGLGPGSSGPRAYAPGSPEDNRLRTHTRYLVDSKVQLGISLLGVLYGLVMNLVPILAVAYVIARIEGWVIGPHGLNLLRPDGGRWASDITPAVGWSVIGLCAAGGVVYFGYRLVDVYRPLGDRVTTIVGRVALGLLGVGAAAGALLLGVPTALAHLERWNPEVGGITRTHQVTTLIGTLTGLVALIVPLLRKYDPHASAGNPLAALTTKTISQRIGALGRRVIDAVFPWLGASVVIGLVVAAILTWTWNVAVPGGGELQWGRIALAAVIVLSWQALTDVNRTSLHRVYTQRLATAFAVTRSGIELDPPEQPLSRFVEDWDKPRLLVCATVNTDQASVVPTGRKCAPFTFSAYRAGISSGTMFQGPAGAAAEFDLAHRELGDPATGTWERQHELDRQDGAAGLMIATAALEERSNHITLMDLVGVSGAAVSPAMGRLTKPSLRLLMAIANVRLGMWLPNPKHPRWTKPRSHPKGLWSRLAWQVSQPGLIALFREMTAGMSLDRAWIYVTDGGHYENLGLVEALRRGATEIIVFDASGDLPFSLATFAEAVETARADLGVEIRMDYPTALAQVGDTGHAGQLAARCTATYANGVKARVFLCKAAMVDGLPQDLIAWKLDHPDFPNTSTGDQLYGDREFEAYRRLGQAAAEQALTLSAARTFQPTSPGKPKPFRPRQSTR